MRSVLHLTCSFRRSSSPQLVATVLFQTADWGSDVWVMIEVAGKGEVRWADTFLVAFFVGNLLVSRLIWVTARGEISAWVRVAKTVSAFNGSALFTFLSSLSTFSLARLRRPDLTKPAGRIKRSLQRLPWKPQLRHRWLTPEHQSRLVPLNQLAPRLCFRLT